MPFVRVNGLQIHAQEMGEGAPVVLLHGLVIGNIADWYFGVAPELARSRHVLLYDLRGHGKTDVPADGYDLGTLASDLDGVCAAHPGFEGTIDLVGFSYGALIALRFALEHPERVRRLVLIETPFPPHDLGDTRALDEIDTSNLKSIMRPDVLRAGILANADRFESFLDSLPRAVKGVLLHGSRRMRRFVDRLRTLICDTTLIADLRAEGEIPDDVLARLAMPVLCVHGRDSLLRPVGDRLARTIPDCRLVDMDSGHYVISERPAELSPLIEEFLVG